jgi:hypothetical protein
MGSFRPFCRRGFGSPHSSIARLREEDQCIYGEIFYTNRETRKDVIKGNTTTPNRDDEALLEVGAKTGDLTKRMEDASKFTNLFSNGIK